MAEITLPEGLDGSCDERFAAVAAVVAEQLAAGDQHGLAFAAFQRGRCVADFWGGRRRRGDEELAWEADTLTTSFSTTKGVMATALHMAIERAGVSYDQPVASVWPEFAQGGKEAITIRHILCHEGGVPQIRDQVPDCWSVLDWDSMVGVMEQLEPLWEPGTANGYHAVNFGWLSGELLGRIDGRDVPTFLTEELSGPLGLDGLFLGLPETEHHRMADLIGGITDEPDVDVDAAYDGQYEPDSIPWKTWAPRGDIIAFQNDPRTRSACLPAMNGAFTARSLAKLYAVLERGGELDGVRLLSAGAVKTATEVQNTRQDLVIGMPVSWRLGYMSGGPMGIAVHGPSDGSYGHMGVDGSVAGVDPTVDLSFAFVFDRFSRLDAIIRSAQVIHTAVGAAGQ